VLGSNIIDELLRPTTGIARSLSTIFKCWLAGRDVEGLFTCRVLSWILHMTIPNRFGMTDESRHSFSHLGFPIVIKYTTSKPQSEPDVESPFLFNSCI
jgi:hypothetical protein